MTIAGGPRITLAAVRFHDVGEAPRELRYKLERVGGAWPIADVSLSVEGADGGCCRRCAPSEMPPRRGGTVDSGTRLR